MENKKSKLLRYRRQSLLPRYDLAVKDTLSSGYQQGRNIAYTNNLNTRLGDDISGDINTLRSNILPNTVSTLMSSLGTLRGIQNVGSYLGNEILKRSANKAAISLGEESAKKLATEGVSSLATDSAKSLAKGIGTAANAVGAAYGLYDLGRGLFGMANNHRSSGDMLNTASYVTNNINGVDYTTRGGISDGLERQYVNAQNTGDTLSNAAKGVGAGAAIGSFFPGLGNVIGGAIGGVVGAIGSLFGAKSRQNKVNEIINNTQRSIGNYNRQAESVAASQGLRNQYYDNTYDGSGLYTADRGMDAYMPDESNSYGYGKVWTPFGQQNGPINSLVGKGESLIDYDNGKASLVTKGTKRVDNIPSNAKEGDNITIAGNDIDMQTGQSFADETKPYTEQVERINKIEDQIKNSKASDKTKQINLYNANVEKQKYLQQMKQFTDRQQMQHQIEGQMNNNIPMYSRAQKFVTGLGDIASEYMPYLYGFNIARNRTNSYKNSTPYAYDTYAENPYTEQALRTIQQLRFDPTSQLNSLRDTYRQGVYANNQMGGLSAGQRAAMLNYQNTAYAKNRAAVLANADEVNNKYRQAFAEMASNLGNAEASRRQQANVQYYNDLAAAKATRLRGIETGENSMNSILNTLSKHLFDAKQTDRTMDYNERLLRLYGERPLTDIDNKPNNTAILNNTSYQPIAPQYNWSTIGNNNTWLNTVNNTLYPNRYTPYTGPFRIQ